jgi:hypothetical protein
MSSQNTRTPQPPAEAHHGMEKAQPGVINATVLGLYTYRHSPWSPRGIPSAVEAQHGANCHGVIEFCSLRGLFM